MATEFPFSKPTEPNDPEVGADELWINPEISFTDDDIKPKKESINLPENYRIVPIGEYCEQIDLTAKRVEHKKVTGISRLEEELKAAGVSYMAFKGNKTNEVKPHVLAYFEEQHREIVERWLDERPPYIAHIGIDGLSTSISPN